MRSRITATALAVLALAACSGAGDESAATTTSPATVAATTLAPVTTAPATTLPPTTTPPPTTIATTVPVTTAPIAETWHRDTMLAVNACADKIALLPDSFGFLYDFDDPEYVEELVELCDEASDQLAVENGDAAADVSLYISELMFEVTLERLDHGAGGTEISDRFDDRDFFVESFELKALVPDAS